MEVRGVSTYPAEPWKWNATAGQFTNRVDRQVNDRVGQPLCRRWRRNAIIGGPTVLGFGAELRRRAATREGAAITTTKFDSGEGRLPVGRGVPKLRHGPSLDLADALPGQAEMLADLIERAALPPVKAEAQPQDPPLPPGRGPPTSWRPRRAAATRRRRRRGRGPNDPRPGHPAQRRRRRPTARTTTAAR